MVDTHLRPLDEVEAKKRGDKAETGFVSGPGGVVQAAKAGTVIASTGFVSTTQRVLVPVEPKRPERIFVAPENGPAETHTWQTWYEHRGLVAFMKEGWRPQK
jgi:hypothetical protein